MSGSAWRKKRNGKVWKSSESDTSQETTQEQPKQPQHRVNYLPRQKIIVYSPSSEPIHHTPLPRAARPKPRPTFTQRTQKVSHRVDNLGTVFAGKPASKRRKR